MQNVSTRRPAEPILTGQDVELVAYIAQMSSELARMAESLRLEDLARALRAAQDEAQVVAFGQDLRQ